MTAQPRALVDRLTVWNALVASFGTPIVLAGKARAVMAAGAPGAAPLAFDVGTAQGRVRVELAEFPLAAATGVELSLADLGTLPAPLPQMLTEGLREMLLSLLPAPIRSQITEVKPAEGKAEGEVIAVSIDGAWAQPALLRLVAPLATFAGLAASLAPDAALPALPQALAALIPAEVRLALRGQPLPLSRLRSLGPGDMLLLPRGAPALLLGGRLVARLSTDSNPWTLTELAVTDDADLPEAGAPQPAASIDDLPVTLSFVVETRRVTLADLQALRPGAALPFAAADPARGMEVQVLANGRVVGAGNIVEIDGQRAVRLSRLFAQG